MNSVNVFFFVVTLTGQSCCVVRPLLTYQQLAAQIGIEKLEDDGEEKAVSNEQLLNEISPQLYLKNIDYIITYIRRAPITFDQEVGLLYDVIRRSDYGFTYSDIAHIILGIADSYATDYTQQEQILDLLLKFPEVLAQEDLIYIAAKHGYKHILKTYLQWFKSKSPSTQYNYRYRALLHAMKENNIEALKLINDVLQPITKHEASSLVWYAAHTGKGVALIDYLKALGADVDVVYKDTTPLVQAVMRQDKAAVQMLINAGADVNKLASDLEIGSPLQQAIETRNVQIENMLRRAGAHE